MLFSLSLTHTAQWRQQHRCCRGSILETGLQGYRGSTCAEPASTEANAWPSIHGLGTDPGLHLIRVCTCVYVLV